MPGETGAGIGAVVVRDGKLLMVQRGSTSHGGNTWAVPGGWIDKGESPTEAAEREVLEETGIKVSAIEKRAYPITWPVVDGVASVCIYVECTWLSGEGEVREPDKCPKVEWIPLGEVKDLPLFPHTAAYWASLGRLR